MSEPRVATYEVQAGGLLLLGRHESLAASSSVLPMGAYTTLRTYGGRGGVRLDQHLRRLEDSVALQGQPGAIDPAVARRAIAEVLDGAETGESRLRLTFSPPRLFVAREPFVPLPKQAYQEGVACLTVQLRRENPHAKDTRFIATAQNAYGRLPPGIEEGLVVGDDGAILEGLSSNFFAVLGGCLRTEEDRALIGVTRSLVLEVAAGLLPVERRAVHRGELSHVSEAFLTSVSREVLPVVTIDGRAVGDGRPGARTRAILAGFEALVARETERL